MRDFSDQCLDMARSVLSHHIGFIQEDGTLQPAQGEAARDDDSGHVAFALGEFYRATHSPEHEGHDLVDAVARTITAQTFLDQGGSGIEHAGLALLAFGPALDRNAVWERLVDETRERLTEFSRSRKPEAGYSHIFSVARSIVRYSLDLSKKDDTGKIIDAFLQKVEGSSSAGFFDTSTSSERPGLYELEGLEAFVFLRQALQMHAQSSLRERKLPSLRTYVEKYLRLIPDLMRRDGLGWTFGRQTGVYGQMTLISLMLQALSDGWAAADKVPAYYDCLRRLFHYFFATYCDNEHGCLVIRDAERDSEPALRSHLTNFDAVRFLSQWARLSRNLNIGEQAAPATPRTRGRYVSFNKNNQREHGVFLYQDAQSGLNIQLPLVSCAGEAFSGSLAFPHCPGIFDWPVAAYIPVMLPELTFGEHRIVPSFYGKSCVAGLDGPGRFYFRYQQPELIDHKENIIPGLGSCRVEWTFKGGQLHCLFAFKAKQAVQLDSMRYVLPVAAPHHQLHSVESLTQGEEGLGAAVLKDDFQATWADPQVVSEDPDYRTYTGKIHYLQTLERPHPLKMQPGKEYCLELEFHPDITLIKDH